jgi:hypothetical protein
MERRDREMFDRDYNAPPGSRGMLGIDRDDRSETSSVSEDIWGSDIGGVSCQVEGQGYHADSLSVPILDSTTRRPQAICPHPKSC